MNKQILIIGTAILLLIAGFSGCISTNTSDSNDIGDIEIITISGVDTVRVINYLNKPVKLIVSGIRNNVSVEKNTNLVNIVLSGIDNIIRVSRSHSFDQTVSGVRSKIVFYD